MSNYTGAMKLQFKLSKPMNTVEQDNGNAPAPRSQNVYAAALLIGLLCGCGQPSKVNANDAANAPRVAVVKSERRTLSSTLEIASEFQPYQEIDVYAKVSGYIQKLYVDWGTHVKQGQLLAVLEIPELQQQLQLDEAAVHRSEQICARCKEELSRAESAYNVAHLTYTRLADVQKTRPDWWRRRKSMSRRERI